jgi:hypothetical protein
MDNVALSFDAPQEDEFGPCLACFRSLYPGILILQRYTVMYDAYFEEKALIPDGRLHEVAFSDLEKDPLEEMAALYERLGLPGFDRFEPKLRDYVASLRGYQKNRYHGLAPGARERVAREWRRSFEVWGYSI